MIEPDVVEWIKEQRIAMLYMDDGQSINFNLFNEVQLRVNGKATWLKGLEYKKFVYSYDKLMAQMEDEDDVFEYLGIQECAVAWNLDSFLDVVDDHTSVILRGSKDL